MTRSWTLTRVLFVALLFFCATCTKKQDLVTKAFEGKDFDRALKKVDQSPDDVPKDEEDKAEGTKIDVVVDKIGPRQQDTVYMQTGKPERLRPGIFKQDPEAPILNFEDAKLYDVIYSLCELLGVNFIIDPSIKDQTVTISMTRSDQKLKTSDLFDLLLKLHDLTVVEHGSFINIVPIASPDVNPGLDLLYGSRPNKNLRREELVMQIVPLRYVKAADMNNIIKEFLSGSARTYEEPINNVLIIVDKYQFISKAMELIPIFDVDLLANKKMVYYELAFVDAVETAGKLSEILSVYGYEADGERLTIVPIETLNGLLVVSSTEAIFKELNYWIDKFDQEASYEEDQVFVYKVENTTADTIANTLGQIFGLQVSGGGGGRGSAGASQRRTTNPNQNSQDPNNRLQQQQGNNRQNQQNQIIQNNRPRNTSNQTGDGPRMIIDYDNNNLIFMTTPRDYSRIYKTLKKLDILPRQVFLEVSVLTVDLDDTFRLGINWSGDTSVRTGPNDPSEESFTSSISGDAPNPFTSSYSYTGATGMITATINALKTKGYANVLQQPHIMAIDNQSASISVGADIPIETTTTNLSTIADGTGNRPASSSTIQYRNTGVSLSFTPHINANGVIRLEISLDISAAGAQAGSEAVPITQNSLTTEMIVRDGQTVVMGGLIFDQEEWSKNSVPLLGRIPILRHFFTNRRTTKSKSELIVMITPRLIDSEQKSIDISREFKDKILKEFESFRGTQFN